MFGLSIIPMWAKALVIVVVLALLFGSGYKTGYDVRDYEAQKIIIADQQVRQAAMTDLILKNQKLETDYAVQSQKLQEALTNTHTVVKYVNKAVNAEVAKNPIYHTCILPKSGVQVIIDSAQKLNDVRAGGGK